MERADARSASSRNVPPRLGRQGAAFPDVRVGVSLRLALPTDWAYRLNDSPQAQVRVACGLAKWKPCPSSPSVKSSSVPST